VFSLFDLVHVIDLTRIPDLPDSSMSDFVLNMPIGGYSQLPTSSTSSSSFIKIEPIDDEGETDDSLNIVHDVKWSMKRITEVSKPFLCLFDCQADQRSAQRLRYARSLRVR
jgi:hypothetical protein